MTGLQVELHIPTKFRNTVKRGDLYFSMYEGKYYFSSRQSIQEMLCKILAITLMTDSERQNIEKAKSSKRALKDALNDNDTEVDE